MASDFLTLIVSRGLSRFRGKRGSFRSASVPGSIETAPPELLKAGGALQATNGIGSRAIKVMRRRRFRWRRFLKASRRATPRRVAEVSDHGERTGCKLWQPNVQACLGCCHSLSFQQPKRKKGNWPSLISSWPQFNSAV